MVMNLLLCSLGGNGRTDMYVEMVRPLQGGCHVRMEAAMETEVRIVGRLAQSSG